MKWLAALAFLALPAHAGSVTATAPSCPSHNGFSVDAAGNLTITCTGTTPPVTPPPISTIPGCPATPANVVMGTLLTSGLAGRLVDHARTDGLPPTIYSFPLPKNPFGGFFTTRDPDTPPSMNVSLSFSKCPGDYAFAVTDVSAVFRYSFLPNNPYFPCIATGSAESGSLYWGAAIGQNTCKLDLGMQWYANIRVTDDKGLYSCPPASASGPGCPLRYWWN